MLGSPLTKGTWFSKAVFNLSTSVRRLGVIRALLNTQSQLQWSLIILHHYLPFANMQSTEIFELKFGNCYQILTIICSQRSVIFSRAWLLPSLCISPASSSEPSLLVQLRERDSSQGECLDINHIGGKKRKQNNNPIIFSHWPRFAASLSRSKVICDSRGSSESQRINLLSHAPVPSCSLSCTWELFKPESRGRGEEVHAQQREESWRKQEYYMRQSDFHLELLITRLLKTRIPEEHHWNCPRCASFSPWKVSAAEQRGWSCPPVWCPGGLAGGTGAHTMQQVPGEEQGANIALAKEKRSTWKCC